MLLPDIDTSKSETVLERSLKEALEVLRRSSKLSDDVRHFGITLPLEELATKGSGTRCYAACCIAELLRIDPDEELYDCPLIVQLFADTLPHMAHTHHSELIKVLRLFQWYEIPRQILSLDDEVTMITWHELCCALAASENDIIVHAIPTLILPVCEHIPIVYTLEAARENPSFFSNVVPKIQDYSFRLSQFFHPASMLLPDAKLFADLAILNLNFLVDFRPYDLLSHPEADIRVEAVRAFAILDPGVEWARRRLDDKVSVRRQWLQSALQIGYCEGLETFYRDKDAKLRSLAYSAAPPEEARFTIYKLMRHSNAEIAADAATALAKMATTVSDLEQLVRWTSRYPKEKYHNVTLIRPVLDCNINLVLEFENDKTKAAVVALLVHTLKFYNAITAYTDFDEDSPTAKAVAKWLTAIDKSWKPFEDLTLEESSSNFKKNAVPLFPAEWIIENAKHSDLVRNALLIVSEKCPRYIHSLLPNITSKTPTYMLAAIAHTSKKFPKKIVNPATTILCDICLQGSESSKDAAEILYNCAQALFTAIAPEILEKAVQEPSENMIAAVEVAAKVIDVYDELEPKSMQPHVAPVFAKICPIDHLADWLSRVVPKLNTDQTSKLLVAMAKRDLPTVCLPLFASTITDSAASALSDLIKKKKATTRLIPLMFFNENFEKNITNAEVNDVYGLFARLVFVLAINDDLNAGVVTKFCIACATEDNISTLIQMCQRFKHFELKYRASSQSLYSLSELTFKVVDQFRLEQEWSLGHFENVKLPADCYSPLPLTIRESVLTTRYLEDSELLQLTAPKRLRV